MIAFTARSRCLYILRLLYRRKCIRYILLSAIFFLIVLAVSFTELRHRHNVIFTEHENTRQNSNNFMFRNVDNANYVLDFHVRSEKENYGGFRFEEKKISEDKVGIKSTDDIEGNQQRFTGESTYISDDEKPSFIGATREKESHKDSNIEPVSDRMSFNVEYINKQIIVQEEFRNVHSRFDHANEGAITSRGFHKPYVNSHLVTTDDIPKHVYDATPVINYIATPDTRNKLNTEHSENNQTNPSVASSHHIQFLHTTSKIDELEPRTVKPLSNSLPSNQNTESTRSHTTTEKKCKPVENVIFLKTHKTGSSTIINIIQRYAHTHHLKVALPNITHFLGWPNTFRERYVFEHSRGDKYNILCNHARFHRERMLNIMESKNTKIITIIRDPLYQFESTAVYLNFYALFKINRKLNLVDAFFNKSKTDIYNRTKRRNTHNIFLVKNPIAYDLGFPTWKDDERIVKRILKKVKNDFHLVMISDYMAESLIMLKEELCWDLKDIVYFAMNKRPDKLRQKIRNITEARLNVKKWNNIDYKMFEYYNSTFWKNVRKGGRKFQEDVKTLKDTNDWLRNMCLQSGRHFDKSQPWFPILGFKLKNDSKKFKFRTLCENMIRSEIDYTNLLKLKHTKFNWTVPTSPPKKKKKLNYIKTNNRQINQQRREVLTNKDNYNIKSDGKKERNPDTG